MALNLIVPDLGDVTDPETIQQIFDDLTLLRSDVDKLLNRRLQTTTRTSNSGTFTAETSLDTVTASLTSGRRYKVVYLARIQSSVADGYTRGRIREDNVSGTQLVDGQMPTTIAANQSIILALECEYTAVSTGSKTFAATAQRQAGTGNLTATASATSPTLLYVEYITG